MPGQLIARTRRADAPKVLAGLNAPRAGPAGGKNGAWETRLRSSGHSGCMAGPTDRKNGAWGRAQRQ